jgi:hypothetical protein
VAVAPRHEAVEHEHQVAVVVGVVGVPHRHRHHLQCAFERVEIGRLAHSEPLLEHLRPVEAGNAHRHGQPVLVVDHGAVNALADLEHLLADRSIGLLDFQRLRGALEGS